MHLQSRDQEEKHLLKLDGKNDFDCARKWVACDCTEAELARKETGNRVSTLNVRRLDSRTTRLPTTRLPDNSTHGQVDSRTSRLIDNSTYCNNTRAWYYFSPQVIKCNV